MENEQTLLDRLMDIGVTFVAFAIIIAVCMSVPFILGLFISFVGKSFNFGLNLL